jgi:S1-C subfamily serine protease
LALEGVNMSMLAQLNDEMAVIVDRVRGTLVEVSDGRAGRAAGIVWHTKGLIVTNAHIINHDRAEVTLPDGHPVRARVLAIDRERDLAALSVETNGLTPIAQGCSRSLDPGQFVIAVGHPWGLKGVATAGIIMGVGAEFLRISYARDMVAVNLPLRPGSSGGPLVDSEGRLVGINTMMTGPDTGLAIPVDAAKAFLETVPGRSSHIRV